MIGPVWLYGVAALALAGGGFYAGAKVTNNSWKAGMLDAEIKHASALKEANDRNNELARALEASRANIRTVFKTIEKRVEKVVDRPVFLRECFDDDGLRLANEALTGQASDPGEPDRPVSGPVPLGRSDGRGDPAKAGRGR